MIFWIKNVLGYTVCAIAANALALWIQSTVITDTLLPNLTTIVLALLAINVQTTAVIAVKLRDIADKHEINFNKSIKQFRIAFYEQGSLVLLSILVLALTKAKPLLLNAQITDFATLFVFFASMHIFIDTTIGLLVCLFPNHDD